VPRRTRKRCIGKHLENNDRRERERELRDLEWALRLAWCRQLTDQVVRGDLG
jgi:hypothetical protein